MGNLVKNPGYFSRPSGVSFKTIANPVGNNRNSIFLVTFMLIFIGGDRFNCGLQAKPCYVTG